MPLRAITMFCSAMAIIVISSVQITVSSKASTDEKDFPRAALRADEIENKFEPEIFGEAFAKLVTTANKRGDYSDKSTQEWLLGVAKWLVAHKELGQKDKIRPLSIELLSIGNFNERLRTGVTPIHGNISFGLATMCAVYIPLRSKATPEMEIRGLVTVESADDKSVTVLRCQRRFRYTDDKWKETAFSIETVVSP